MRADRLLSILLLLQARGRMTAQQLAEEMEVSVRTIYRDIDALSGAGVPVYAERGPGGGCELIEEYRTDLTGLTEDEVRALFMLSIPAALEQLGVSRELEAAWRKLAAALPSDHHPARHTVQQRIYLDWSGSAQPDESVPHLQTIQRAVWESRRLHLTYRIPIGPWVKEGQRVVDPYGLVSRDGVWHLVYARDGHIRTQRVSHVVDAHVTDERFERPAEFDLVAFWEGRKVGEKENAPSYPVTARVSPELVPRLVADFGERIQDAIARAKPPAEDGWLTLTLPFRWPEEARGRILSYGGAIEVLEPEPLRLSVLDFAEQIVKRYEHDNA